MTSVRNDRERWDRRHAKADPEPSEPDPLLRSARHLLTGGSALDLAAGSGRNSLYLAGLGYTVDAVDISPVAMARLRAIARERRLPVRCIEADLDEYEIPETSYDLVIVFRFFSPTLMPLIEASLKPGGLLVYSTFNLRHLSRKPNFNPDYLVPQGGLAPFFTRLEVILDEPEAGEDRNLARFIGRKPTRS